jgi:hypothetical protein
MTPAEALIPAIRGLPARQQRRQHQAQVCKQFPPGEATIVPLRTHRQNRS